MSQRRAWVRAALGLARAPPEHDRHASIPPAVESLAYSGHPGGAAARDPVHREWVERQASRAPAPRALATSAARTRDAAAAWKPRAPPLAAAAAGTRCARRRTIAADGR